MSTYIAIWDQNSTAIRRAGPALHLGQAAGLMAAMLWVGTADRALARTELCPEDGCEQTITNEPGADLSVVPNAPIASVGRVPTPAQTPPTKGASDKPEGGKPKSVPSGAKRPAEERPKPSQAVPPAKTVERAPSAEGAKTPVPADATTDGSEIGEGPDALAQKFAELLEKRRAEAAANAAAKKPDPNSAAKVAPKPSAPAVEPASSPEPKPAPTPEPVVEPTAESSEIAEPVPADQTPVSDGPPTVDVLVLQTADALADVPRTERIGQLILTGGNVTNRSLKGLEGLTVTELSIEAIRVSNTGIQHVRSVRGIRRLRLWTPEVDDTGLSHLAELQALEVLDIEGTSVQGGGLVALKGLPKLETLVLGPKTSDAQLAALQELPALSQLDLRACPNLTLECVPSLAQLRNLKTIWLPSHIRAKAKRVLSEALPACEVRS